jgi:hypothetical protein
MEFKGYEGYRRLKEGTVRLWDAWRRFDMKHYDFRAWEWRNSWKQVPYGTINYTFEGDAILEGMSFWLSLHSSPYDSVFLYAKVEPGGTPSRHNELYKVWDTPPAVKDVEYRWSENASGLRCYGSGASYAKILKNEPDEIIVESGSIPYERAGLKVEVVTTYRVVGGKPWLEIAPVSKASEQDMHGESRIVISPQVLRDGGDFVVDSLKHGLEGEVDSVWLPDGSLMLLDFAMDISPDVIWMMTWPTPYKEKAFAITAAGGWPSGWDKMTGNCPRIISSPMVMFNGERVVIGVVNTMNKDLNFGKF